MKTLYLLIIAFTFSLLSMAQTPGEGTSENENQENQLPQTGDDPNSETPSGMTPEDSLAALKDTIELRKKTLEDLKKELTQDADKVKKLEAEKLRHQSELIKMASKFLYIPYEKITIEEIVIPAFNEAKNTPEFKDPRYKAMFDLLTNYRNDIGSLNKIIKNAKEKLAPNKGDLKVNAMSLTNELKPLLDRYQLLENWQGTFLGYYINEIQEILNNPQEDSYKVMDNLHREIRLKLSQE